MSFGGRIFLTENRCPLFRKMLQRCSQQTCLLSLTIGSAPAELPLLADRGDAAVELGPWSPPQIWSRSRRSSGDTARATILAALMGGQALTGSELAFSPASPARPPASTSPSWSRRGWSPITKQGRYRYYRIASPLVAHMLESIIAVAAIEVPSRYQPRSVRTMRCASRAPVTTIWPARSASRSRTRSSPTATSSWARTAAR